MFARALGIDIRYVARLERRTGASHEISDGICARLSGHRLLPIDWPDGPQTVKANQRGNKTYEH
jgi:hypothetical protein